MAALPDGLRAELADRYRIDRELGRGGMATVYLAHDLKHDRPVALKLLHQELAAALGPGRFLREIRTAARLQHPHILGLLDSGETAGLLWYTMPYVEGESLRDRLRREVQLPVEDAIRISQETALALDYAHRHGVIHRDIKPENILLSDGQALVADFGLAQALDHEGGGNLTGSGIAVGTPAYMSPEQASAGQVGPRSDVYALGCVLYELLAGEPPFSGSSAQAILAKRVSSAVPRVRVLRPTVPEPLEQAVTKALAPMAADRYATAGDFCRALATAPIFTSGPTLGPSKGPTAETPTKSARQVFRAAATLGLGLLIGVAVLFAWLRTGPSPNAPGPKRVAVLPFENIGDSADAYFADGVTDAVRGKLVGLPGLQVTARGSSSQYRGTTKTPQQIGQELGVQFLLTATVRWEKVASRASRVQVTPELVEVASATTTWQRPFDAALTGVFQVQAEIAGLVAQALDLELSDSSRRHLAERPTQSLEAYDAYLRGQEVSQGMTSTDPAAVRRATLHYAQAVALDSGFYQAWAQLSGAHSTLYLISIPTPAEAEAALRAAERALALAPKRVEGHLALSAYYSRVRQDHALALEELARAEQLAPPDANLLKQMAVNELNLGRWEAALAHLRRAWSLDPRSVNTGRALTMALLRLRRYPEATEAADRAGALAPTNLDVIMYKAMVSLGQGDLAGARSVIMAAPKEVDPIRLVAHFATYSDLYWVLNDTEQRVLLGLPPDAFDDDTAGWGLVQAQILWQRGERARARVYADSARIAMQGQLRDSPQNAERRALYGLSLAYLGRKSDAVREGERSLVAMPIKVDAYNGPYLQHQLARIYILINEPEKALDLLEPLLGVPYLLSPGWLRIDPTFDPLRSHPRFQRLVVGRPSPASKRAATRGQP